MSCDKKWIGILLILCFSACSVKLFPTKDEWYAKHYIIMQNFEWDTYKKLSTEGKQQFQELFWKVRHPDAKKTFMSRLDAVIKNFKTESYSAPWNTDRGRIFLLNGNPAELRYVDNINIGGTDILGAGGVRGQINVDRSKEDIGARKSELWVYPYKGVLINYQFNFSQPRQWKLNPNISESAFREELELHSRAVTYEIMDVKKYQQQLEELKKIN